MQNYMFKKKIILMYCVYKKTQRQIVTDFARFQITFKSNIEVYFVHKNKKLKLYKLNFVRCRRLLNKTCRQAKLIQLTVVKNLKEINGL